MDKNKAKANIPLGNLAAETLTAEKYLMLTAIFNNKNLLHTAPKRKKECEKGNNRRPLGILKATKRLARSAINKDEGWAASAGHSNVGYEALGRHWAAPN